MTRMLALAAAFVLLAWPAAAADYRGSDMLSNIGPSSQVEGGLADKYPLSAYALDYQVDVGVADPNGVPAMIAQWAAAQLWTATSLLVKCTIDLFTWAYSLDLLGGPDGALAPVGTAITSLYENVIGQAWMVVAILLAGIWGIWKALVQRRYTETAGALATSMLFVVIALFFVYQPERTVGQAAQWTNTVSLAFLSGANRGSLDDPEQAKRQVADHLFQTLLYQPWVVLEFGGLAHCVDTDQRDPDGFPQPVAPDDPARDVCRDHITADRNGYGGYAERFLRQAPGSKARAVEATAIRDGEVPFLIRTAGRNPSPYKVDKADAPAVDIQQEGGAFQRLTFSVIVAIGALGAVALLGFLSLAVILAQIIALVLLGFAPVALIVGIFPGQGHAFFRGWLSKLATAVFIKVLYSLVIAIVVAVSAALTAGTGELGFLFAFALQTIFFWALFLYRKQISSRLVSATTGSIDAPAPPRLSTVQKGAQAAGKPFSALAGVARPGKGRQPSVLASTAAPADISWRSESPLTAADQHARGNQADSEQPDVAGHGHDTAARASTGHRLEPVSAPATRDDGASDDDSAGPAAAATDTGPRSRPPSPASATAEPEATPRSAHEDVMRRARELRDRQQSITSGEANDD